MAFSSISVVLNSLRLQKLEFKIYLVYLVVTSSLVGVDNYSDWPEEIQSLPRLGSDLNIDMDKVEALQPDLVLASLSVPGMERNIEELKKRNIPYVIYHMSLSLILRH